jgi:diguanylate cyclase (GGDEF)-like protein
MRPADDDSARAREELQREMETRTELDADQTSADLDQTQADSDQEASDADQRVSDTDQTLADRDQNASDRDQAAADVDRSHASGSRAAGQAYDASRTERDATSRERDVTAAGRARATAQRLAAAAQRDEVARVRDLAAAARDRTAEARDRAADARDRAAEARERHALEAGHLDEAISPLRALRTLGASVRRQAAVERVAAARDREAAAEDRLRAAADSRHADLDELTGVFRRGSGELALTHEIERSRRFDRPLVLAIIDVDALKDVNDNQGHAAGDALLRDVPAAIISTLRSYDVTVRWGGDEFVCALYDVSLDVALHRLADIQRALEALRPGASISAGLALVADDDTLESAIARADTALYRSKVNRGITNGPVAPAGSPEPSQPGGVRWPS